ncbi:MAG: hypothetical protein Cons2KO_26050 [Congregibacter sp.]
MLNFYLKRELAVMQQSPARWGSLVLFAVLSVWALMGGLRWQAETERVLDATPADLLTDRASWFAELDKVEAGEEVSPYAARPVSLTTLAIQRPGELAALAFRDEAMDPRSTMINGWRSEASLFRRYEVQGPSALQVGRLDMAFVVTVLLPLFLLILAFDVISSERDAGRYPLFLVQGGNPLWLLLARLLVVAVPLLLVVAACVITAAVVTGASIASTLLWLAIVFAYSLFWMGVTACIAVWVKRPVAGAMAVLATWALIVVLIPSASQFTAQAMHPLPSRVSFLSEARDAEGQSRRNVEKRAEVYMAEHPGQSNAGDDAVPGFYRSAYLANLDINERVKPIVQRLEAQQAAQRGFVNRIAYASPAILVKSGLQALSGTGVERSAAFRRQARDYLGELLSRIGPATVSKSRLTREEALAIGEFEFVAPRLTSRWLPGLIWTLVLAVILLGIAGRRAANTP